MYDTPVDNYVQYVDVMEAVGVVKGEVTEDQGVKFMKQRIKLDKDEYFWY